MVVEVVIIQCKVEQEEGLLTLTEIASSSKYKSESEANTSPFLLPLYMSSPPTPLPLLSLPSPISLPLYVIG